MTSMLHLSSTALIRRLRYRHGCGQDFRAMGKPRQRKVKGASRVRGKACAVPPSPDERSSSLRGAPAPPMTLIEVRYSGTITASFPRITLLQLFKISGTEWNRRVSSCNSFIISR